MIYTVYTTTCAPEGGSVSFATSNKENAVAYAKAWHEANGDGSWITGALVLEWPDDQEWTLEYEEKEGMRTVCFEIGFEDEDFDEDEEPVFPPELGEALDCSDDFPGWDRVWSFGDLGDLYIKGRRYYPSWDGVAAFGGLDTLEEAIQWLLEEKKSPWKG